MSYGLNRDVTRESRRGCRRRAALADRTFVETPLLFAARPRTTPLLIVSPNISPRTGLIFPHKPFLKPPHPPEPLQSRVSWFPPPPPPLLLWNLQEPPLQTAQRAIATPASVVSTPPPPHTHNLDFI
ncbi:unnamed protein product [Gadus morhua 'NCC']